MIQVRSVKPPSDTLDPSFFQGGSFLLTDPARACHPLGLWATNSTFSQSLLESLPFPLPTASNLFKILLKGSECLLAPARIYLFFSCLTIFLRLTNHPFCFFSPWPNLLLVFKFLLKNVSWLIHKTSKLYTIKRNVLIRACSVWCSRLGKLMSPQIDVTPFMTNTFKLFSSGFLKSTVPDYSCSHPIEQQALNCLFLLFQDPLTHWHSSPQPSHPPLKFLPSLNVLFITSSSIASLWAYSFQNLL